MLMLLLLFVILFDESLLSNGTDITMRESSLAGSSKASSTMTSGAHLVSPVIG